MLVRLKNTSGDPPEGIFNCTTQDIENIYQMVYVGLYNAGGGKLINDNIKYVIIITIQATSHWLPYLYSQTSMEPLLS